MLKLNDQFNSVSFLDKVQIGKLNFYPIKFDLKEIPIIKVIKNSVLKKFFTYSFKLSLFLAIAKFGDPPNTGSVILNGTGTVFSVYPKTGRTTKKCKK